MLGALHGRGCAKVLVGELVGRRLIISNSRHCFVPLFGDGMCPMCLIDVLMCRCCCVVGVGADDDDDDDAVALFPPYIPLLTYCSGSGVGEFKKWQGSSTVWKRKPCHVSNELPGTELSDPLFLIYAFQGRYVPGLSCSS